MILQHTNTLVIGASISGLASAACLQKQNIEYIIIERNEQIASPWLNHYERLHLHTSKRFSHLPYKKFGKNIPRYPSRQQVLDYLKDYQNEFNIFPAFNLEALSVNRVEDGWMTETKQGQIHSKYIVMATGPYDQPNPIHFKGMASFEGRILHSADYKTGKDFRGQKVLVVGFGNSACEIAIDLTEQGAAVSMSVRSEVNIVPRDVLGIPVLELSLLLSRLSPRIADTLSAPLLNGLVGGLGGLGLEKKPYGPLEQIRRDGKVPVLDIGTLDLIRKGEVKIRKEIDFIEGKYIYFKNDLRESFDAIVAGIGFSREGLKIVHVEPRRLADLLNSTGKQKYFGESGLYFCGYWISPTGQIREIALDAQRIARHIAAREGLFKNLG
jgi:indole-3-pyruvate monooxygenase